MAEPEIWDPATQPRRLTLFAPDVENPPFVIAMCEPRFWQDGNERFYVPIMSAQLLTFYLNQCQAADDNGTWSDLVPAYIYPHGDDDPAYVISDELYESVIPGSPDHLPEYAFDRLPWRDASHPAKRGDDNGAPCITLMLPDES